jgi:hypothetical protein
MTNAKAAQFVKKPFCESVNFDGFVKSPKIPFSVIPEKAGIQSFQAVANHLDSGFHRSDDFLRVRQLWALSFELTV